MSEESPSGENINGNNSIAKRKRKKTVSMVDLSIRKEGSTVISNYLQSSSSASKRLKKDMEGSSFHDRVKGEDGVSCFNPLLSCRACQVKIAYQISFLTRLWVGFHMVVCQKLLFKKSQIPLQGNDNLCEDFQLN